MGLPASTASPADTISSGPAGMFPRSPSSPAVGGDSHRVCRQHPGERRRSQCRWQWRCRRVVVRSLPGGIHLARPRSARQHGPDTYQRAIGLIFVRVGSQHRDTISWYCSPGKGPTSTIFFLIFAVGQEVGANQLPPSGLRECGREGQFLKKPSGSTTTGRPTISDHALLPSPNSCLSFEVVGHLNGQLKD